MFMSEDNETQLAEAESNLEAPEEIFRVEVLRMTDEPSDGTISGKRHESVPFEITESLLDEVRAIIDEMNVQPFGWDAEGGPTAQDLVDTIQYNLNHEPVENLGLSDKSVAFIENSGLFETFTKKQDNLE